MRNMFENPTEKLKGTKGKSNAQAKYVANRNLRQLK